MILTTFDFQAPEFYTARGCHLLAVVDDDPHGHQSLLLQKDLGNRGGASEPGAAPDAPHCGAPVSFRVRRHDSTKDFPNESLDLLLQHLRQRL
jgi:hypothetical protein